MNQNIQELADAASERRRQLLTRLMQKQSAARKVAPMSFAQQRLWFLDQLTSEPSLYNMANPIRLKFAVDVGALRRAIAEIVRRHEILRTTFGTSDGTPVQIVSPAADIDIPVIDLEQMDHDRRDEEAEHIASDDYNAPFDLRTGPLFRFKLLRLSADDYVLLVTMHHIVSDGWSLGVFFGELNALYGAYSAGQASSLPELPIQYGDFSIWQRKYLEGEVREEQLSYWKTQLAALSTLQLPTDRPRPALPSFRGARVPVSLNSDAVAALRSLGRDQNVTPFIVFLAAFEILLYRYSGQEDVVVGSPVAGRNRTETEGLIGFFVNSVVMRSSLAGDPSFRDVVDRVRETALGAYAHQDLPFEMLVEELHPERDLARNPLFQVIFQLLNGVNPNAADGTAQAPRLQTGTAKFDLSLTLYDSGGPIDGWIEYAADLFDRQRIERLAGHYAALVESIALDPGKPISKLNLLTASESREILGEWIETRAPFPRDRGILELIKSTVTDRPDAPAVSAGGRALSYRDLNGWANRLAAHLVNKGAAPGAIVAIQLPRSPELIVAALAVLKTGAAYLPIDCGIPDERLTVILGQSSAVTLITENSLEPAGDDPGDPVIPYDEDALAYVIFTSGSTGTPKGVEIPHRGLTNLIAWHNRAFEVFPGSRASQFAGSGFDASVWEIWPYLAAGAAIEIVPDQIRYAPALLPEWFAARGITHCFVPTPILDTVVRQPWPPQCNLRFMLTGGDRLLRGVPAGLPFRVFNQYGPTESSVVATSGLVPEDQGDGVSPSIGRAIANVELFIVDRDAQPVPAGIPGELWIGGMGLARGYLNAPEVTAERFVDHPLRPGQKVYRSGDLVRYTTGGEIEFLGRLDRQVKIRGFRIELGEIETVLAGLSGVEQACVLARHDIPGDPRLVAYVTGAPDAGQIREKAREKLPGYMVPCEFVRLEAFPLNASGKIDREKLPAPPEPSEDAVYIAPRTRLEQQISVIWREELHVDRVGIDENFFDIGGNSLTLVRIHLRLEEQLSGPVSVVELFRYPTIRSLAVFLGQRDSRQSVVEKARERAARRLERAT